MKILYVKNNSERAKKFQLKTIIYEKDGQKFVRKEVLCKEAIPHLKQMKNNYKKLTDSIVNPKLKLARIIDENNNSLTFEFIDNAISFEHKFNKAKERNQDEINKIIKEYQKFIENSFKTTRFDSSTMVTDKFKSIFGDIDYSVFDNKLCFDGVSNIDLIFSNILFKDDCIYLIDYEWVFDFNIPLEYSIYRSFMQNCIPMNFANSLEYMEDFFIMKYVVSKKSFYRFQKNFMQNRFTIKQIVLEKEQEIARLQNLAQSLRIKNRLKRIIKKVFPIELVRNKINLLKDKPSRYNGNIIKIIDIQDKMYDTICFFSHYDKDGLVDDYVYNYLKSLNNSDIDIVFISTAQKIRDNDIKMLGKYCRDIILKENIGYDFGAWKTGLDYLRCKVPDYSNMILCNDSVYAPMHNIKDMINIMQSKNLDFWGITDNFEVKPHLQSYFIFFNKNVFSSSVFKNFWDKYLVYKNKRNIIEKYEIGLTTQLSKNNFKYGAYCEANKVANGKKINITHFFWKELILKYKCPIIKIELLRDNPMKIDNDQWKDIITENTTYNTKLIEKHLTRFS